MGSNENVSAWLDAAPDQVRETTQELLSQVEAMRDAQTIYPPQDDILNALAFTAPADVRVVILGQDPSRAGAGHGAVVFRARWLPSSPAFATCTRRWPPTWDVLCPRAGI